MNVDKEAEKMAEEDAIKIFTTLEQYQCVANSRGFDPQDVTVVVQTKICRTDFSIDNFLLLPLDFAEALIDQYFKMERLKDFYEKYCTGENAAEGKA